MLFDQPNAHFKEETINLDDYEITLIDEISRRTYEIEINGRIIDVVGGFPSLQTKETLANVFGLLPTELKQKQELALLEHIRGWYTAYRNKTLNDGLEIIASGPGESFDLDPFRNIAALRLSMPTTGPFVLYGKGGTGKSAAAVGIARAAVQSGIQTLYLSLEDPAEIDMRKNQLPIAQQFTVVRKVNLLSPRYVKMLKEFIESGYEFIIVDPIGHTLPGKENSADTWRKIHSIVTPVIPENGFWMYIAHMGKDESKGIRGSSAAMDLAGVSYEQFKDESGNYIALPTNKDRSLFGLPLPTLQTHISPENVISTVPLDEYTRPILDDSDIKRHITNLLYDFFECKAIHRDKIHEELVRHIQCGKNKCHQLLKDLAYKDKILEEETRARGALYYKISAAQQWARKQGENE